MNLQMLERDAVLPLERLGAPNRLRIVALSDTHGQHEKAEVPHGDVLVHAGDFGGHSLAAVMTFLHWLERQPHENKVLTAGNHDGAVKLVPMREMCADRGITYLEHEAAEVAGLKWFGSPYTPRFGSWSFMIGRGMLRLVWAMIPDDVDVLITHGPPHLTRDLNREGESVGCADLTARLRSLQRPSEHALLHVFGHIHESAGYDEWPNGSLSKNVAFLDRDHEPHPGGIYPISGSREGWESHEC